MQLVDKEKLDDLLQNNRFASVQVHTHTHTHEHTHEHTHAHAHSHVYICKTTDLPASRLYLGLCLSVYAGIYMHACVYAGIYMHANVVDKHSSKTCDAGKHADVHVFVCVLMCVSAPVSDFKYAYTR